MFIEVNEDKFKKEIEEFLKTIGGANIYYGTIDTFCSKEAPYRIDNFGVLKPEYKEYNREKYIERYTEELGETADSWLDYDSMDEIMERIINEVNEEDE